MKLRNDEGGIEWLKIIIPLLFLWAAWISYSSYEVRHVLDIEARLDQKFNRLSGIIHTRVSKDNDRHEDRIDNLYLLIAGGQDEEKSSDSGQGAGVRSGSTEQIGGRHLGDK